MGEKMIGAIILGVIAIASFIFSYLQFHEKGFLFNNAYIYATPKEREEMDKKPHYRQSGIVFCMIGIIFLFNAFEMLFHTGWLAYGVVVVAVAATVYAVVSSIIIESNKRKK